MLISNKFYKPDSILKKIFKLDWVLLFVVLILAYPLLDVIRVFIIRTYNGRSFMSADRNHIHHKLVEVLNHMGKIQF